MSLLTALGNLFQGRLTLTCGDSKDLLPSLVSSTSPPAPFDYFFVDGNHLYEYAYSDIVNGCRLSREGATMAVDDCDDNSVRLAWIDAVKNGVVQELHQGLCWEDTCYGRCLKA